MSDPNVLRTAALIQQTATLPKLTDLLDATGAELPDYATLAPGIPDIHPIGNLRAALERVGTDPAASAEYAAAM